MKRLTRVLLLAALLGGVGATAWYVRTPEGSVRFAELQASLFGGGPGLGQAPAAAPGGPGGGPARPVAVEAQPVKIAQVARTVTAVGTLLSNESVVIRPEILGRIAEIGFQEGAQVRRGDVLVRLDDAVPRATL
jgi:membrane fusion protein (multidrug efflux system)